jgi:hypothetical protein
MRIFMMIRFVRILLLFASIFMALFAGRAAKAQEIDYCSFSLPKAILQAHASFNVIYEFDVDQHGTPINIKPVGEQFAKLEGVQTCLAKWSLPQSASTHLVAVFEWQHGTGWTKLAISGPTTKLSIRLSGDRCPYPNTVATTKLKH